MEILAHTFNERCGICRDRKILWGIALRRYQCSS